MTHHYYDRTVDSAWFGDPDATVAHTTAWSWGLEDRDTTGKVVGIEVWNASHHMPACLLVHLPRPPVLA